MYKTNTERLWKDSKECTCNKMDCNLKNHRICPICGSIMLYGSHFSNPKTLKSNFAWNIDFIIPKADGGNNKISNLRAVHIKCNKTKNRKDQSGEY